MTRGWKYLIVALIDVEANYLVVKAYQYTTLTSIQMLDCITIPVVLFLSICILNVRYRWTHITGVVICMVGLGGLILVDALTGRSDHGDPPKKLLGDMLCLLGASLYGFSNVAEEYAVRFYTRVEFLGMVGLFATFISGTQLLILERDELTTFSWNVEAVFLLIGFAVFMFSLYSLFPLVIKWSSAAVVNLSILTADMYSLLIGLFLFKFKFSWVYILAYAIIMLGILVYGLRPTYQSLTGGRYKFFRNSEQTEEVPHRRIKIESSETQRRGRSRTSTPTRGDVEQSRLS
ncbi:putative solute carrier family 35 member F2-like [Apostichopus japonicus]|uniref:Putative solute carrier family 35 member F2-like n=1 Tax=Stichopus japonicus TaxID=307972 RepID=A0A2G8KQL7_STIJA|nr:putative solute carrier family 35 member F2-like [Apostichopus japonicus]